MKKIINSNQAPAPIGPYSQAVLAKSVLYCSGQIAMDPKSGALITETLEKETDQVLRNLGAVLIEAGMNYSNVVKCSIFLNSMNDFAAVNEIYGKYFSEFPPARETVEVSKLPKGVNVEISAIAVR
jgi:2-iminobutanoate/2-iminopropanoate deaminase|tara:strand:- start:224 stop:601 length:378 start_codon:yes stop_codon:yes gene_type:complete